MLTSLNSYTIRVILNPIKLKYSQTNCNLEIKKVLFSLMFVVFFIKHLSKIEH